MYKEESQLRWIVTGALVGSAAMFFFDPVQGRRRRALLRDKARALSGNAGWYTQRLTRDLGNRTRGLIAEARHSAKTEEQVDDRTLEARVRSEFGRKVSHAKAIRVEVRTGVVTLHGPILEDEVPAVLSCVRSVKGVKDVVNQMDQHRTSERIPGLQGEGKPYLQ